MSRTHNNHVQVATLSLIMAAIVAAFFYARFLLEPSNRGDLLPYGLLIIAEAISMFQLVGAWWTILAGINYHPDLHRYEAEKARLLKGSNTLREYPTIDIFITVCGEPIEVVRRTAIAARNIMFPHKTYLLDDGHSEEVYELAKSAGVGYISRPTNENAKAGNINYALDRTQGEYVAIFDADHVPSPEYLDETLPHFWDKNLAFVQTPQYYDNRDGYIAAGASEAQDIFYTLISPGKNRFNSVFWVGTNAIFSRKAFESIGGVYPSNSEDIWTSYLLHQKGWRSIFLPKVLAIGKAPDTAEAYLKQQLRWATGGLEIFFRANPLFSKGRLTTDQKIQYFLTTTYYFTGLAVAILILLPVLYLYFDISPIAANSFTWLSYFLPYLLSQFLLIYHMKGYIRWQVVALSMATFPVHIKAIIHAARNKKTTWQATNGVKVGAKKTSFHYVLNQVGCIIIMITASMLALLMNRLSLSLFVSVAWTMLNIAILSRLVVETLPFGRGPLKKESNQLKPLVYETNS